MSFFCLWNISRVGCKGTWKIQFRRSFDWILRLLLNTTYYFSDANNRKSSTTDLNPYMITHHWEGCLLSGGNQKYHYKRLCLGRQQLSELVTPGDLVAEPVLLNDSCINDPGPCCDRGCRRNLIQIKLSQLSPLTLCLWICRIKTLVSNQNML